MATPYWTDKGTYAANPMWYYCKLCQYWKSYSAFKSQYANKVPALTLIQQLPGPTAAQSHRAAIDTAVLV